MPRGRPTKYNDAYTAMAFTVCSELGATNRQFARLFGVGSTTLDCWMIKHAEFRAAIKRGKEIFDTELVEQALLKLGIGYNYTERTSKRGKQGLKLVKVAHKKIVPNITAQIYWLINRMPGRCR